MSITRTVAAVLAAGALAVPAAQAATVQSGAPGAPGASAAKSVPAEHWSGAMAAESAATPAPAEHWSGATAAESASELPASQPSAPVAKATDGGVDGASLAIGIAGALVAAGGVAAVGSRRRRLRPAV